MDKARQAHFRCENIDNHYRGDFYGTEQDLTACIGFGVGKLLEKHPGMRRGLRKAILRKLFPEWLNTAAVYCVGCSLMLGAVALFGNGLVLIGKAVGLW